MQSLSRKYKLKKWLNYGKIETFKKLIQNNYLGGIRIYEIANEIILMLVYLWYTIVT